MTDIFDVIADGTRRDILDLLLVDAGADGEGTSVSEIVEKLGISQPTVSKHLKVLRDADVVVVREDGQRRFYRLAVGPLERADEWLLKFVPTQGKDDVVTSAPVAAVTPAPALPEGVVVAAAAAGRAAATAKHAIQTTLSKLGL